MKKEHVARQDGKAFRTNAVSVEGEEYKDDDYTIEVYSGKDIGETGLLEIGGIVPRVSGLPRFLLRWDERQEALDVDIEGVSPEEKLCFKSGQNGHRGHHTNRAKNCSGRMYDIDIALPGRAVFKGRVFVPLLRKLELRESLKLDDQVRPRQV
jgi:hypothetical protein